MIEIGALLLGQLAIAAAVELFQAVLGSPFRAVGTIGTGPCTFSLGVFLID